MKFREQWGTPATSQLVTQSARHAVMSSLCQLVTSQIVSHVFFSESTRHNAVIHDGQRHTIFGDFKAWRVDRVTSWLVPGTPSLSFSIRLESLKMCCRITHNLCQLFLCCFCFINTTGFFAWKSGWLIQVVGLSSRYSKMKVFVDVNCC